MHLPAWGKKKTKTNPAVQLAIKCAFSARGILQSALRSLCSEREKDGRKKSPLILPPSPSSFLSPPLKWRNYIRSNIKRIILKICFPLSPGGKPISSSKIHLYGKRERKIQDLGGNRRQHSCIASINAKMCQGWLQRLQLRSSLSLPVFKNHPSLLPQLDYLTEIICFSTDEKWESLESRNSYT